MKFRELPLAGCFECVPDIHRDERGSFSEQLQIRKLEKEIKQDFKVVQANISVSSAGVIRGLHLQTGNNSQAKYVTVPIGRILDVVVDLRPDSITFGKHASVVLDSVKQNSLYVPRGLAHGFLALEEGTRVSYFVDNFYEPNSEVTIDPFSAGIDWQVHLNSDFKVDFTVSKKDLAGQKLEDWMKQASS